MKIVSEVTINCPLAKLKVLVADPGNNKHWMEDLTTYEPLSGKPGQPGSTARLVFGSGRSEMEFTLTTQKASTLNELRATLENPRMTIGSVSYLTAITPKQTKYRFEQNFAFKGLVGKLMGLLARGPIAKQQQKHTQALKQFAENNL